MFNLLMYNISVQNYTEGIVYYKWVSMLWGYEAFMSIHSNVRDICMMLTEIVFPGKEGWGNGNKSSESLNGEAPAYQYTIIL